MDWGITLLGDSDISYLSQNHAVAHMHSDLLCVCVCIHHLSPLSLCVLAPARTIKPAASPSLCSLLDCSQGCFRAKTN